MKVRAEMFERRQIRFISRGKPLLLGLLSEQAAGYSSDSDDSRCHFSDDDELVDKPEVLNLIERGILPPELSVLHGCCLAGQGGTNFLAFKFMESLNLIPQDTLQLSIDTTGSRDICLEVQISERGIQDRTEGFALVAEALQKMGKTKDFASWLAPLFSSQVTLMTENGALDSALQLGSSINKGSFASRKRYQVIKVLSASSALLLDSAQPLVGTVKHGEAAKLVARASCQLAKLISSLWVTGQGDRSISRELQELIRRMEHAARLSLEVFADPAEMIQLFKPVKMVVALFSRVTVADLDSCTDVQDVSQDFFKSSWLSESGRHLALLAYNLGVATDVSFFSGWEHQQFNLTLIRRRGGLNHFGVTVRDGLVFGKLSSEIEIMLVSLWNHISEEFPDLKSACNFPAKLYRLQQEESYMNARTAHEKAMRENIVAQNGEMESLRLLLHFSKMCLLYPPDKDEALRRSLLATALSIMVPLSQFCVCEQMWDAEVGRLEEPLKAEPQNLELHALFSSNDVAEPEPTALNKQTGNARRTKRTQSCLQDSTSTALENDEFSSVASFIVIPCSRLLDEWNRGAPASKSDSLATEAKMANLNCCLLKLRRCSTEAAVESASLNVSVALLSIAAEARNPFLCIEQAARFASLAPKRGTSDLAFQTRLPDEQSCSPTEALIVLGRADCLQAVFFCEEAMFLCNFVASICKVHCSEDDTMLSRQWKLVRVKAYNVYVAIRYTATKVTCAKEKMAEYRALYDELVIGRDYALTLQSPANGVAEGVEDMDEEQVSQSDADENYRGRLLSINEPVCLVEV
jgi:hypothetical protein